MSNNNTVDVEGPPEGGISADPGVSATLEGAAPGTIPLGSPTATLEGGPPTPAEGMPQPSARGGFMEIPSWLGGPQGPLGQIMGGMAGMGGQAQSPGEQVHQRHGGFLTGLAGVLIEGLASGMAPNAQMAYQIPLQIQQQRMQQQQLQMQQVKLQEEMREAPIREQMQWAQTLVTMQQLRHAMATESDENQLHINDLQHSILQKAQSEDRLTVLGTGSLDDVMAGVETARNQDPKNATNIFPWYQEMDNQGHILKAAIVRIDPESLTKTDSHDETTFTVDGKQHKIGIDVPAGTPTRKALSLSTEGVAKGIQDAFAITRPETPQQGLAAATAKALQEGRDPAKDSDVQKWEGVITDIQKDTGEITKKDIWKEQMEDYRQQKNREAQFALGLQKNGLETIDKMYTDPTHGYTQFLAEAQATQKSIDAAKNGNQLAASLEPMMIALGVSSFAGVHRINDTEINRAGPGLGSVYRRVNAMLDKAGSGTIPTETLREATGLINDLIDARHSAVTQGALVAASNTRLDPSQVTVMNRNGVPDTLANVGRGVMPGGAATAPKIGDIKKGHRYLGGDPHNPKSWQKVTKANIDTAKTGANIQ